MTRATSLVLGSLFALSACAPAEKGLEADAPMSLDGKEDSFAKPTEHGELGFGVAATAKIQTSAAFHAWTFTLSGAAQVRVATERAGRSAAVDTVLYLYKKGASSWGRYVARNDDADGTLFSAVDKPLGAGSYRVIVKGYGPGDQGSFGVRATCSGAGCQPAPAASCLFGATFGDIAATNGLTLWTQTFTSATGLLPVHELQIVKALHASTHTDVTTVAEAFAAADGHELNKIEIYDRAGARAFTGWEYGAGDNSYGAIFASGTDTEVAVDHDSDLMECTVAPATCLFGSTYGDALEGGAFTVGKQVITAASTLTALQKGQLVRAVKESNDAVATVAAAFASVDGGEVNVVDLRHGASGRRFTAFEFGAGDNSYGALFAAGTTDVAAAIHDGDLYACTAF